MDGGTAARRQRLSLTTNTSTPHFVTCPPPTSHLMLIVASSFPLLRQQRIDANIPTSASPRQRATAPPPPPPPPRRPKPRRRAAADAPPTPQRCGAAAKMPQHRPLMPRQERDGPRTLLDGRSLTQSGRHPVRVQAALTLVGGFSTEIYPIKMLLPAKNQQLPRTKILLPSKKCYCVCVDVYL